MKSQCLWANLRHICECASPVSIKISPLNSLWSEISCSGSCFRKNIITQFFTAKFTCFLVQMIWPIINANIFFACFLIGIIYENLGDFCLPCLWTEFGVNPTNKTNLKKNVMQKANIWICHPHPPQDLSS